MGRQSDPRKATAWRANRFFTTGHTPGPFAPPPEEEINADYPLTLDLRRLPRP